MSKLIIEVPDTEKFSEKELCNIIHNLVKTKYPEFERIDIICTENEIRLEVAYTY